MRYRLDFDRFIEQAVTDIFSRYTIMHGPGESNLSRVAKLGADDLIKEWGPELAAVFQESIRTEMERQLNGLRAN
jgi:hypothetical protein